MVEQQLSKLILTALKDGLRTILYFPVWWYSKGLLKFVSGGWSWIKDFEQTMGFSIWLKNLFVPMFGQTDIAGRLISFFLRLVQVIFRGIFLLLFCILVLLIELTWLVLPIFIIYQIIIRI